MTVIGPRATLTNLGNNLFNCAAQIRRNSSESIFNSIMMGWPTGLLIDASKGTPTDNNIPGTLFVQNTIIAGCKTPVKYSASALTPTGATSASILDWFNITTNNNTILTTNDDVKLTAAFDYASPDFTPASGSPALSGATFSHASLLQGFTPVDYRGAVGAGDTWFKGWSKF